jgi:hypothetical protein
VAISHIRAFTTALGTSFLLGGTAIASAQDSPSNQSASIVAGTCAKLGSERAFRLREVSPNDPRISGSFSGQNTALGVMTSESDVNTTLTTLLNNPHAIVIGDLAAPLAFGDIGGFTRGIVNNDEIEIGISEIGDSNHFGIASLEGDGDEIEIDLYIAAPMN